jgi:hypothetical protein
MEFEVLAPEVVNALSKSKKDAYNAQLAIYNEFLRKEEEKSSPILDRFTFRDSDDSYFDLKVRVIQFMSGFTTKKDGTALADNASDIRVVVQFPNGKVKSFSAYSSMFGKKGLPKLPLEGLECIATFKEQDGYEPRLANIRFDEEAQHGRILKNAGVVLNVKADF